jgi:predicted ABC-type ATPase
MNMNPADRLKSLIAKQESGRSVLSDVLKYSPDQARDERGRFGSGGGASSAPDGSSTGLKAGDPGIRVPVKSFAGNSLKAGEDSLHSSLVADGNGGWRLSANAQARLDSRIRELTTGVPKSDNPTLFMLGGGPASGKSTATNNPEYGLPDAEGKNGPRQAVLINADEEKFANPIYKQMQDNGQGQESAGYLHEESSYFAKQIQKVAYANGQDVLLDGTGDTDTESVLKKIADAEHNGYRIDATYVTCPTDQAVERAAIRAQGPEGRHVPEAVITDTHANVSAIVPQVANKFDSFRLIDTTSGAPWAGTVIATATKGSDINVTNPQAWDAFVAKSGKATKAMKGDNKVSENRTYQIYRDSLWGVSPEDSDMEYTADEKAMHASMSADHDKAGAAGGTSNFPSDWPEFTDEDLAEIAAARTAREASAS